MQKEFYLLIVGGRDFFDYEFLIKKSDYLLQNHKDKKIIIVSGLASGADSLGELYALDKGYEFIGLKAEWDKYNKFAGHIRNQKMSTLIKDKEFKGCICFWDNKSKGTYDMISICKKDNIPLRIYKYDYSKELTRPIIRRSKNNKLYCSFESNNLSQREINLKKHLDRLKIFNFSK